MAADNVAQSVDCDGVIAAGQINVTMPAGTDLTALVSTFTTTGACRGGDPVGDRRH